jgi:hypothetical protein
MPHTFHIGASGWAEAAREIRADETIAFLTGEIVATREMLRRFDRGEIMVDDPHQVSDDLYILLDPPSKAFGHSCDPSAGIRGANELFALRRIAHGERISFDFSTVVGTSSFDSLWRMECRCGAEHCRREIRSVLFLPAEIVKRYSVRCAFPDFIIRQLIRPGGVPLGYRPGTSHE